MAATRLLQTLSGGKAGLDWKLFNSVPISGMRYPGRTVSSSSYKGGSLEQSGLEARMGCDRDKLTVVLFKIGPEIDTFALRLVVSLVPMLDDKWVCAVGVEGGVGESALVSEELKPCGRWLAEELMAEMIGVFLPLLNLAFGGDVAGGGGGAGRAGLGCKGRNTKGALPIDGSDTFLFSGAFFSGAFFSVAFFPSTDDLILSERGSVQDAWFVLNVTARLPAW